MEEDTIDIESIALETRELFHRGFDAGNHANAYVSDDLETAFKKAGKEDHNRARQNRPEWIGAFVIGFFGTYEDHEILDEYMDRVAEARGNYGRIMHALGIAVNLGSQMQCPECDAIDGIQDNGASPGLSDYTLLCTACGHQWEPNQ